MRNRQKTVHTIFILFLFVLSTFSGLAASGGESASGQRSRADETFHVDTENGDDDTGDGSFGKPYKTIQKGVDSAGKGDTVLVRPGTYNENVAVEKIISLRSTSGDPTDTIVKAINASRNTILISADHVNVSGFTLQGATTEWYAGLYVNQVVNGNFSDNFFSENSIGFYLNSGGGHILGDNTVQDNDFFGCYIARSEENILTGNDFSDNNYDFYLFGETLPQYTQDIDTTNKVAGKSVYYWVGEEDKEVPEDAGFIGLVNCSDITVRDQTIRNTGYGALLAYTTDSEIENLKVSGCADGIYLWHSTGNSIRKSTFNKNGWDGIELQDGSDDNTIEECEANFNGDMGIELDASSGNHLKKNKADTNDFNGIRLYAGSNSNEIRDSSVSYNGPGVFVYQSEGNLFSGNTINSNEDYGIWLSSNCEKNIFEDNIIKFNEEGVKISSNGRFNSFTGNTVSRSRYCGIKLETSCTNNNFTFNTVEDNGAEAIEFYSSCNDNLIANNSITGNDFEGILLISDSDSNTIRNNMITDNDGEGIELSWSNDNLIYNNYLHNPYNAKDTGEDNLWNLSETEGKNMVGGPKLGGNFWSDYDGEDTDRDGFGDTPQDIDTNFRAGEVQDLFPLVPNKLPVIKYTQTPKHPVVDQSMDFDASSSRDDDGSVASYAWDFGDGNDTTGSKPSHSYTKPGSYQVTLTLTDNEGAVNDTRWTVSVYEKVPPFITVVGPGERPTNLKGEGRVFMVETDQTVDVNWYMDGKEVQTNNSVTKAWYANLSAEGGPWNVTAVASNANGSATQNWDWFVSDHDIRPLGQLGGWGDCVAVAGDHAYLGQGVGLYVLDISGDEPELVTSLGLPDEPVDIAIANDKIFLANSGAGLAIFDISEPAAPEVLGRYPLVDAMANGIAISGDHAYLAAMDDGVFVLDISDPTNPALETTLDVDAEDAFVAGSHLYLPEQVSWDEHKLQIFSLADPADPSETGSTDTAGSDRVFVSGNYAYMAGGWQGGLEIIDVSDPADPQSKSIYGEDDTSVMDVYVNGDYAYVAGNNDGFLVLDVSDPTNPELEGSLGDLKPMTIFGATPKVYLVQGADPVLQVVDISDPANPGTGMIYQAPLMAGQVDTERDLLLVGADDALWLYNDTGEGAPALRGRYPGIPLIMDLELEGDYAYVVNNTLLFIFDISDPANIKLLDSYESYQNPTDVTVKDDIAYLVAGSILEILDVSDPSDIREIDWLGLPGTGRDILLGERGLAYLAYYSYDEDKGMVIVNLSDPEHARRVSTFQSSGDQPTSVWAEGERAYLGSYSGDFGDYEYFLQLLDVSVPEEPTLLDRHGGSGKLDDLVAWDGLVMADIVGGSVHTWTYSASWGKLVKGPVCPSPHGSMSSSMSGKPVKDGYRIYTTESSHGLISQKVTRNPKMCTLITRVSPVEAGQAGCTAMPSIHIGPCGSTVDLIATAKDDWIFDKWTGAASGGNPKTTAILGAGDGVAVAHFTKDPILTLSGGSGPQHRCSEEDNSNVTIISITLSVNDLDSWRLYSVTFLTNGSGNEKEDVKEARLYLDSVSGDPLAKQFPTLDDEPLIFDTGSTVIPKGGSIKLIMVYEFDDVDTVEGIKDFSAKINIARVSAKPMNYENFLKLPNPKVYISGGPVVFAPVWNFNTQKGYENIQAAINDGKTVDGHVIDVCSGTYEENVDVTKVLEIRSKAGKAKTIVQAENPGDHVFHVTSKWASIHGFTIKGATALGKAGIYLNSADAEGFLLYKNTIIDNSYGILIENTNKVQVYESEIAGNDKDGIFIRGGTQNVIGGVEAARANVISGNNGNGIRLEGKDTKDNKVMNNFIGTETGGTVAKPNKVNGVFIADSATGNCIGEKEGDTFHGNVISGNLKHGIEITAKGTNENKVFGNKIGTNALGKAKIPNKWDGVNLTAGASKTHIEGNTISGNEQNGIGIVGVGGNKNTEEQTTYTEIVSNRIGTDITGKAGLGNKEHGINITDGAYYTTIGSEGKGNLISGNFCNGITISGTNSDEHTISANLIGTDVDGKTKLGNWGAGILIASNARSNTIGGDTQGHRNIISGNNGDGIKMSDFTAGNKVFFNYIGTEITGMSALANAGNGVLLYKISTGNIIGKENKGNLISGNTGNGVSIDGTGTERWYDESLWNKIHDNLIGTNKDGNAAVPNGGNGVDLFSKAKETSIQSNTISGNKGSGVLIRGKYITTTTIDFNSIGTAKDRESPLPNEIHGVFITEGVNKSRVLNNLISGNKLIGVKISGKETESNQLIKNKIGTDHTGKVKLPNGGAGVEISEGAEGNIVGGDEKRDGNLISGNKGNGVTIKGKGTESNKLIKNKIGTDDSGKLALGNEGDGVEISGGATYNRIGGRALDAAAWYTPIYGTAFEENIISGNAGNGVWIKGKGTNSNMVRGNKIGMVGKSGFDELGNGKCGVVISGGASNNRIGGDGSYHYNIIGDNKKDGIQIVSHPEECKGNIIQKNHIGVKSTIDIKNRGYGIRLLYGSRATKVRGNTIGYNEEGGVWDEGKDTAITGNTIQKNKKNTGIHLSGSNAQIIGNTITGDEHDGIVCENGSNPTIHFNNIYGNEGAELNNLDGSVTVDARYNWWGSADGSGSGITGGVDSSSMLTEEVGEGAGYALSGENSSILLNGSVVADYKVTKNLSLDVLSLMSSPYGTLENELGIYYLVMVNDTANLTELTLRFYYTSEDIAGRKPSTLKPAWWDGTRWQEASNLRLDTTSTGNFSGFVEMTIKAGSSPLSTALDQLLVGLAAEPGADHEITVSVGEIAGSIEPGESINVTGTVTVDPVAPVKTVKLLLDGEELATGTLANGNYWVEAALPEDLTKGEHTIKVVVTLENGESQETSETIRYGEEDDDDDGSGLMILLIVVFMVVVLGLLVQQGVLPGMGGKPGPEKKAEETRKPVPTQKPEPVEDLALMGEKSSAAEEDSVEKETGEEEGNPEERSPAPSQEEDGKADEKDHVPGKEEPATKEKPQGDS